MKLKGTMIEQEFRRELINSKKLLFQAKTHERILGILRDSFPTMRTAYFLGHTPDQGEDLYTILIHTDTIVSLELDRYDLEIEPIISKMPVQEYKKGLSKTYQIKLAVALDLASKDLDGRGTNESEYMDYEGLINNLLEHFPSLRKEYCANDHIHGLPHCVFENILIPEIEIWCQTEDANNLIRLGDFLEELLLSDDLKIIEVVNVSVFEPIVLGSKSIIPCLSKYLHKTGLHELMYWQKRYSTTED
jgi:hypothetical protein